jgi:TIR domain
MPTPLPKRTNDLFISYGHGDRGTVSLLVDWLTRSAGLKVWYDTSSGSAAQRTTNLLSRGIESARGALFFLSPNWTNSTWCRDEHEVALAQRRADDEFLVVAAQISNLEIPAWFQASQVLDLRKFDSASAAALLRSLSPNPPLRVDNDQDVYYSGPWSNVSGAAKDALRAVYGMGWRLVGDSKDHSKFSDSIQRITSIIESSRGLVAILPFRPGKEPHRTSPWVLDEARIARDLGRPFILMAEEGVVTPPDLATHAFGDSPLLISGDDGGKQLRDTLQDFDEMLSHVRLSDSGTYSFFAASLIGEARESDELVSVVERVTNMNCVQGRYLTGQHAQDAIVQQIRGAAFVIADVTDDNRNSLIESGVARGAGVPLHLICRLPADGNRKTRFMLQDLEVNWYTDPLERIGIMYRISRRYRRTVLMPSNGI